MILHSDKNSLDVTIESNNCYPVHFPTVILSYMLLLLQKSPNICIFWGIKGNIFDKIRLLSSIFWYGYDLILFSNI